VVAPWIDSTSGEPRFFYVFFGPGVARRLPAASAAVTLTGFLAYLHERGHARNTIHLYVRAVEVFLQWLRQCQQSLDTIDETIVLAYLQRFGTPQGSCAPALQFVIFCVT
jgi:hypothetical protein